MSRSILLAFLYSTFCYANTAPKSKYAPMACLYYENYHLMVWTGSGEGWEQGVTGSTDQCGNGYYGYDEDDDGSGGNNRMLVDDFEVDVGGRRLSNYQDCKTYKNRRYYLSTVEDFVNAYGYWEGSGVTGECHQTTITTTSGDTTAIYAQIGCSKASNKHNRMYLNYFHDQYCEQPAKSWLFGGVTIASKEIKVVSEYNSINWWSNKYCSACVSPYTGYDMCEDLLCQPVTECTPKMQCYSAIMAAISNKKKRSWYQSFAFQLVFFSSAMVGVLFLAKKFVLKAKEADAEDEKSVSEMGDDDDDDSDDDDDNKTEQEVEMSEYHQIT